MKTVTEDKFDKLVKSYQLTLKPLGFKKRGNNFYLQKAGFGQHINFQKSPWYSKEHINFTINTGVFLPEFWSALDYNFGKAVPEFPSETQCILRQRIGRLRNENDTWYDVKEDTDLEKLTETLLRDLNESILPHFNAMTSKDKLKDLVNRQTFSGIPPYEKMIALGELGDIKNAQIEYTKLKKELNWNIEFLGTVDNYAKKYGLN
jgi:hypothetical protein